MLVHSTVNTRKLGHVHSLHSGTLSGRSAPHPSEPPAVLIGLPETRAPLGGANLFPFGNDCVPPRTARCVSKLAPLIRPFAALPLPQTTQARSSRPSERASHKRTQDCHRSPRECLSPFPYSASQPNRVLRPGRSSRLLTTPRPPPASRPGAGADDATALGPISLLAPRASPAGSTSPQSARRPLRSRCTLSECAAPVLRLRA